MSDELAIKEAAALLGVSEKTLRRWDASGELPASRDAQGHRVYQRPALLALAAERKAGKRPGPALLSRRAPRDRFVGREEELARLRAALSAGERLISLLGPAGVGKTRLALRHAELAGQEGEVFFADLSEAHSEEDVVGALSAALELPVTAQPTQEERRAQLHRAVAARGPVLLIADNCEQVTGPAAAELDALLHAAPALQLVATSREPLRLAGELRLEVRTLAPEEARTLYTARAEAAGAQVKNDEPAALDALLAKLDGLPLAIELAAARAPVLSVRELAGRVDAQLTLLRSERRDLPERHRTLSAAVAGSWQALSAAEQAALAQLAVFRGGFTPEAAEAILGGEGVDPLELLQSLRERSLLRALPSSATGATRLGLYEAVRAFAEERLVGAAKEEAHLRHARSVVKLADEVLEQVDGAAEGRRRQALLAEQENLKAVLTRCERTAPALAARAALALALATADSTPMVQRQALQLRLEALCQASGEPLLAGRAALLRGELARAEGPTAAAGEAFTAALAAAQTCGARWLAAAARLQLSAVLAAQGDTDGAQRSLEAALEDARALGDERAQGTILAQRGDAWMRVKRPAEADACYQAALPLLQRADAQGRVGLVLTALGLIAADRGEPALSERLHVQALEAFERVGDRRARLQALNNLAVLHSDTGALAQARARLTEGLAVARADGFLLGEGVFCANLAAVAQEEGQLEEAGALLDRSRELDLRLGVRRSEAIGLLLRGMLELERERLDEAAAAFAQARAGLEAVGLGGYALLARGFSAATVALRGDPARARVELAEVDAAFAGGSEPRTARIITALYGFPEVVEAAALRASSPEQSETKLSRAEVAARLPPGTMGRELRLVSRLLLRRISLARAGASGAAALELGPEAEWFCAPGGERVSLSHRHPLRRILLALGEQREKCPGVPLSTVELSAAGWPGEKLVAGSGESRTWVALSTLRKLGLKELLRRTDVGYLLDADVPLLRHGRHA